MLLIFGLNSEKIASKKISGGKCPICESYSVHVNCWVKFIHLFYFSMFPLSKRVYPYCVNCDARIKNDIISPNLESKIKFEKKNISIPLHMYAGFLILPIIILFVIHLVNLSTYNNVP